VEIVHESLLREWPLLKRWQTQDADAAQLRDQLRQAAQLWQARGRPAELLWSGTPYREFRVWRESYPGGLSGAEQAFADAMVIQAGRRRRRRRLVTAAVLLVTVAGLAVTTTLWRRSETSARRMEARRLAEVARETMERFPPVAFAYAVASLETMDDPEARRLALEALWRSPMPLVIGRGQLPATAIGVDFSPDGRWLSVGHFDGYVAVWPESGGEPIVWQPHEGSSRGYFTPDSRAVLSMSTAEPQYQLWSVPDLRPLGNFDKVERARPDTDVRSSNVVCGLIRPTPDPTSPVGWRCDLRPLRIINEAAGDRVPAAALSPDGSEMVVSSGEELLLYLIDPPGATPRRLGRSPSEVEFVTYDPGGGRLATVHADGGARLWGLDDGALVELREWPPLTAGGCNQVGFDPSGAALAAVFDEGAMVLWGVDDVPASDPLVLSMGGSRAVELSFHPDGRWLAAANMFVVSLWPIERGHHPFVLRGHSGQVEDLAFAPDGSWLASFANDGTVRRWPMAAEAGDPPRVLHDSGHRVERMIGSLAMSPDGGFVATTAGEDVARMVPVDGSPPATLGGFEQRVFRVAVGHQGRLVAVAGRSGDRLVVRVWDREVGTIADVDLGQGGSSVFDWWADLAFRQDGRVLVAFKGQLLLLDPATGEKAALAEGELFEITSARGGDVVVSRPDIDRLGTTTVRDLAAGTEIQLTSHGRRVTSIALDREGAIAVTGSEDGVVRVGPVTGEEPHWLVGPRGDVESVAVSPDGRWIASGHADGAIRLWPMPDLTKPPLHGLPHAELLARLKSLTNLRVVRNPDDRESFVVRAEPFPGWRTVPEW
jgi:WD40 repeat protein